MKSIVGLALKDRPLRWLVLAPPAALILMFGPGGRALGSSHEPPVTTAAITTASVRSAQATTAAPSCDSAGYNGPWGCILLPGSSWAPSLAGLGDLNVYNNGPIPPNTDGTEGPDQGYSWEYQCTELAIRYAAVVWHEGSNLSKPVDAWNNAGWNGQAQDMWSVAPKLPVPLQQIPNGTGAPQFGDLIVFSGGPTGHVGVVVKVSDGRLYFVGENQWNAPAEAWIPINSSNVASPGGDFSNTLQPIGWLRGPAPATSPNPAPPPPPPPGPPPPPPGPPAQTSQLVFDDYIGTVNSIQVKGVNQNGQTEDACFTTPETVNRIPGWWWAKNTDIWAYTSANCTTGKVNESLYLTDTPTSPPYHCQEDMPPFRDWNPGSNWNNCEINPRPNGVWHGYATGSFVRRM